MTNNPCQDDLKTIHPNGVYPGTDLRVAPSVGPWNPHLFGAPPYLFNAPYAMPPFSPTNNDPVHTKVEPAPVKVDEPTQPPNVNDIQHGGTHYKTMAIQPWDYIVSNNLGYLEGNAVKYLSRWRQKNGIEDLKKAIHYIEKLIEIETQNLRT